MHDIIVIGGGPAGLTAALYALRAGKSVLVIEKSTFGGQITWSPKVENFPGIPSVSGAELGDKFTAQALDQGAELELDEVASVELDGDIKRVKTDFGGTFEAKALIIASGAIATAPIVTTPPKTTNGFTFSRINSVCPVPYVS